MFHLGWTLAKQPCRNPAIAGGFVCRFHGGSAPHVKAKARERLLALEPHDLQVLGTLLDRDDAPHVQLAGKAAEMMLPRCSPCHFGGGGGGVGLGVGSLRRGGGGGGGGGVGSGVGSWLSAATNEC
jgi:hypothetical protein